jgi:hypothetical protein
MEKTSMILSCLSEFQSIQSAFDMKLVGGVGEQQRRNEARLSEISNRIGEMETALQKA